MKMYVKQLPQRFKNDLEFEESKKNILLDSINETILYNEILKNKSLDNAVGV